MRRNLEHHRELVAQEIEAIINGADDESSPVYRAVYSRLEAISQRSDTPSLRSSSSQSDRPSSRLALRPSYVLDRQPAVIEEEDEEPTLGDAREVLEEEARLESMRLALHETLRAVSSRLSLALQRAGELGRASPAPGGSSPSSSPVDTSSPSRSAESDATLVSTAASPTAVRPPTSPDVGPFDKPQPVSPELSVEHVVGATISASPYVTMRPQGQRRYRARARGHAKEDSAGGASFVSCSSGTSSSTTPPARSSVQSFAAHSTPTGATQGLGRTASQASGTSRAAPTFSRSPSAMSLSRSRSQTPSHAHSRSPSALSQLSYFSSPSPGGAASETDGAESFVSVSDGGADESLASFDESVHSGGGFELEELASHAVSPTPHGRGKVVGDGGGSAHERQDSFAIDAPPVAFLTRFVVAAQRQRARCTGRCEPDRRRRRGSSRSGGRDGEGPCGRAAVRAASVSMIEERVALRDVHFIAYGSSSISRRRRELSRVGRREGRPSGIKRGSLQARTSEVILDALHKVVQERRDASQRRAKNCERERQGQREFEKVDLLEERKRELTSSPCLPLAHEHAQHARKLLADGRLALLPQLLQHLLPRDGRVDPRGDREGAVVGARAVGPARAVAHEALGEEADVRSGRHAALEGVDGGAVDCERAPRQRSLG